MWICERKGRLNGPEDYSELIVILVLLNILVYFDRKKRVAALQSLPNPLNLVDSSLV